MQKKKPLNIVLLGPPGAGKGTQAGILINAYHLLHISTGDILREAAKAGTEIGKQAAEYMNKGELVPDEIVTELVIERMQKPDAANGIILDGYPRTRPQAESLGNAISQMNGSLDVVLYFKTSEDVAVQRLSGRRVCSSCGKNFHVTNMPPSKEGVCDVCTGELYQRTDDEPETVKNRLVVYEQSTRDLIDYYREQGLLREVDGNISADNLFKEINVLFQKEGLV